MVGVSSIFLLLGASAGLGVPDAKAITRALSECPLPCCLIALDLRENGMGVEGIQALRKLGDTNPIPNLEVWSPTQRLAGAPLVVTYLQIETHDEDDPAR